MSNPCSFSARAPRVTVFLPVYNSENYVSEAIDSVLSQSFTDFELLIIDDGSSDNTPSVLKSYEEDPRVRIVIQDENKGQPYTRNHGLDLARGEYIAFVDSDDKCAVNRLERQVDFLERNDNIDGVGSWVYIMDSKGHTSPDRIKKYKLNPEEIACQFLSGCPVLHPTLLIRMKAFAHYRYDDGYSLAQDYELFMRMSRTCRFANIPEPLVLYRQHDGQVSNVQVKEQDNLTRRIQEVQLQSLGISCTQVDLLLHWCLFGTKSRERVLKADGYQLDIKYLQWARHWLELLYQANAKHNIYPEPEFSNLLIKKWIRACRKSCKNSSIISVVREFLLFSHKKFLIRYWANKLKIYKGLGK